MKKMIEQQEELMKQMKKQEEIIIKLTNSVNEGEKDEERKRIFTN